MDYNMEYPTSHLYFIGIHTRLKATVYAKKTFKWQVGFYMVHDEWALHNYFIPSHRKYIDQLNQWHVRAAHDGKIECNTSTVDSTTDFQYSDWLSFLWHGINCSIFHTRSLSFGRFILNWLIIKFCFILFQITLYIARSRIRLTVNLWNMGQDNRLIKWLNHNIVL